MDDVVANCVVAHRGGVTPAVPRLAMKADTQLFTPSQLSVALGMRRSVFFSFSPKAQKRIRRGYGKVLGFAVNALPKHMQAKLDRQRFAHKATSVQELIRANQQLIRKAIILGSVRTRLAPDDDAFLRQQISNVYFCACDNGHPESVANFRARLKWHELFGKSCNEKTIRRLAARVDDFGGPDLAPIDAYAMEKSFPRTRGGGRLTPGAAATAAARRPPAKAREANGAE